MNKMWIFCTGMLFVVFAISITGCTTQSPQPNLSVPTIDITPTYAKDPTMISTTIPIPRSSPIEESTRPENLLPKANDVYMSKDLSAFSVIREYSEDYDAVKYWRFSISSFPKPGPSEGVQYRSITKVESVQSLIEWIQTEKGKQQLVLYHISQADVQGFYARKLFFERYPYKIGKFDGNYSNSFIPYYDTYQPQGNISINTVQDGILVEEHISPRDVSWKVVRY